jgi:hypothetical protein
MVTVVGDQRQIEKDSGGGAPSTYLHCAENLIAWLKFIGVVSCDGRREATYCHSGVSYGARTTTDFSVKRATTLAVNLPKITAVHGEATAREMILGGCPRFC